MVVVGVGAVKIYVAAGKRGQNRVKLSVPKKKYISIQPGFHPVLDRTQGSGAVFSLTLRKTLLICQ
jgi:hypothetical protein